MDRPPYGSDQVTPPFGLPQQSYTPSMGYGPVAGGPVAPITEHRPPYPLPTYQRPAGVTIGTVVGISLLTSFLMCLLFFGLGVLFGDSLRPIPPQPMVTVGAPAATPTVAAPAVPVPPMADPTPVPAAAAVVEPQPAAPPPSPPAAVPPAAQPAPVVAVTPTLPSAPAPDAATVPGVVRTHLSNARSVLQSKGYRTEVRFLPYNEDIGPLQVLGQTPGAGAALEPGGTVILSVNPEE